MCFGRVKLFMCSFIGMDLASWNELLGTHLLE